MRHYKRMPFRHLFAATALAASAFVATAPVHAAPPTPTATAIEIDGLFAALLKSGCEFSRNGSWYKPAEASQHLQRKYDYLLRKNLVPTTEAFIDRAATKSSVSGQTYRVRCAGQAEVNSKDWFSEQLQLLRQKNQ